MLTFKYVRLSIFRARRTTNEQLLSVAFALLNAKDDRGIRRLQYLGARHRLHSSP
jgi:hypothetical protein